MSRRTCPAGTIDEKIFQRQLMKGDIANMMEGGQAGGGGGAAAGKSTGSGFTREELRELFSLRLDTACDTADLLRRNGFGPGAQLWQASHDG